MTTSSPSRAAKLISFSARATRAIPAHVWIDGKDVNALYEEYKASGAKIRHPPRNYSWALEMQVEDLDSNVLRFASDPRPGEPDGEWLDMFGRRWLNNKLVE
jgi:hypothetical protein